MYTVDCKDPDCANCKQDPKGQCSGAENQCQSPEKKELTSEEKTQRFLSKVEDMTINDLYEAVDKREDCFSTFRKLKEEVHSKINELINTLRERELDLYYKIDNECSFQLHQIDLDVTNKCVRKVMQWKGAVSSGATTRLTHPTPVFNSDSFARIKDELQNFGNVEFVFPDGEDKQLKQEPKEERQQVAGRPPAYDFTDYYMKEISKVKEWTRAQAERNRKAWEECMTLENGQYVPRRTACELTEEQRSERQMRMKEQLSGYLEEINKSDEEMTRRLEKTSKALAEIRIPEHIQKRVRMMEKLREFARQGKKPSQPERVQLKMVNSNEVPEVGNLSFSPIVPQRRVPTESSHPVPSGHVKSFPPIGSRILSAADWDNIKLPNGELVKVDDFVKKFDERLKETMDVLDKDKGEKPTEDKEKKPSEALKLKVVCENSKNLLIADEVTGRFCVVDRNFLTKNYQEDNSSDLPMLKLESERPDPSSMVEKTRKVFDSLARKLKEHGGELEALGAFGPPPPNFKCTNLVPDKEEGKDNSMENEPPKLKVKASTFLKHIEAAQSSESTNLSMSGEVETDSSLDDDIEIITKSETDSIPLELTFTPPLPKRSRFRIGAKPPYIASSLLSKKGNKKPPHSSGSNAKSESERESRECSPNSSPYSGSDTELKKNPWVKEQPTRESSSDGPTDVGPDNNLTAALRSSFMKYLEKNPESEWLATAERSEQPKLSDKSCTKQVVPHSVPDLNLWLSIKSNQKGASNQSNPAQN